MIYEYKCKIDGEMQSENLTLFQYEKMADIPRVCAQGHLMTRHYEAPALTTESTRFEAHQSMATGEVVTSMSDMKEQLKKLSDETSIRMGGMKVDLVPVDARELRHTVHGDGRAESYAEPKKPVGGGGWTDSTSIIPKK